MSVNDAAAELDDAEPAYDPFVDYPPPDWTSQPEGDPDTLDEE